MEENLPEISQPESPSLETPFRKIAMALSGGGFRAASFSIGAMSYLHKVQYDESRNLLDNVEFISSASGGTFPAILYSVYTRKGIPFGNVYKDLLGFMKGEGLLEDVLQLLNNDKAWEGEVKSRNLINSFARIYDEKLFKGETFGVYWGKSVEGEVQSQVGRAVEVCFNSTEFTRGLSFRWQTYGGRMDDKTHYPGKIGNRYISINDKTPAGLDALQEIKLGDIMASSSCFPGGFEPIVYPADFCYPGARDGRKGGDGLNSSQLRSAMVVTDYNNRDSALKDSDSVGLMDGGVVDNQGLSSALLADARRRKDPTGTGFDLIIVSDVASYFMDAYIPCVPDVKGSWRGKNAADILQDLRKAMARLGGIIKLSFWLGVALLAASLLMLIQHDEGSWRNLGFFLLSPGIILLLLWAVILVKRRKYPLIRDLSDFLNSSDENALASLKKQLPAAGILSDNALGSLLKYLKMAKFSVVEQMLKTRLNSGLSMVMDVNLKHTRRLIFDKFYGQDIWNNRRSFDAIYELSEFNKVSRTGLITEKFKSDAAACSLLLDGCLQLNVIAENARNMGTSLWYDKDDSAEDRMMKVVACGQFTTCAKLLEYVLELEQTMRDEAALPEDKKSILLPDQQRKILDGVKSQLLADWEKFKLEPYFVYNSML
jgi:hypothetical protein